MKDLENGIPCLKERSIALEHFETPKWAVDAILKKEILDLFVIDPCCGTGVLSEAAISSGRRVVPIDIAYWNYQKQLFKVDYLKFSRAMLNEYMGYCGQVPRFSVFMNPPFSKACDFVKHSLELGAHKVVCFQRFAWWESEKRREFWEKMPPARVYICGNRASCWRHDLAEEMRDNGEDPSKRAGTPTAHAWFVWDQFAPSGTQLHHIWKDDLS